MNLYSFTTDCTLRIECGSGHGTGFFVGDGLVLTCAHVIAGWDYNNSRLVWPARGNITFSVMGDIVTAPSAEAIASYSTYPYPDIALLRVDSRDNPAVLLGEDSPEPGDSLYAFGYPDDYRNGDSGYFTFEGPTGEPNVLYKLKSGQVRHGMSGSPLLDTRRGAICAMLKGSRGVDTDLGGRAIPAGAILEHLPLLRRAQAASQPSRSAWKRMRSATVLSSLPQLGTAWSTYADADNDTRIVLPSLEIVRLAVQPVSAWKGPADSQYIESVRNLVAPIVELDNLFGGQDLARMAARLFRTVHERIVVGDYSSKIEKDLLSATGEIAEVAGWLSYDADDQRMARQLNHEAFLLSRLSGDRQLELLILQNMSMQAGYIGRPGEALLLARAALEGPPLSSRLSAVFKVREGRALAQEGYQGDARKAFAHARALFSDGSNDNDPEWAWWFEEHELAWHEAMAEADLGNWGHAVKLFEQSIDPASTTSHRDRFVYQSHLLWALAEVGDWRAADEVLEGLSGFVGEVASQRTLSLLRRVERRLNDDIGSVSRTRAAEHLGSLLSSSDD